MKLFKHREFGDYFTDTFEFFKENYKGLFVNFIKLQGILFILLFVASHFHSQITLDYLTNSPMMTGEEVNLEDPYAGLIGLYSNYLNIPFLFVVILSSIMGVVSINFIPLYMELYRTQEREITFQDIINKYKENTKPILILSLILILLFIPLYIFIALGVIMSFITIVGWIFVIGFIISYFSQIWFYTNYYKQNGFSVLGDTFKIFKKQFFQISGATMLLSFIFIVIYYVLMIGIVLSLFDFNLEAKDPSEILKNNYPIYVQIIIQAIGLLIWSTALILTQVQQGMIFYSRVNDIDHVSERQDISSIGQTDINTLIQD